MVHMVSVTSLNPVIIAQKQHICDFVFQENCSQTWKFEFPIIFMCHEVVFFLFLLQLLKNVKDILCSQVLQNQAKGFIWPWAIVCSSYSKL